MDTKQAIEDILTTESGFELITENHTSELHNSVYEFYQALPVGEFGRFSDISMHDLRAFFHAAKGLMTDLQHMASNHTQEIIDEYEIGLHINNQVEKSLNK